ncbi:MAG TPA: hypothetical protein VHQ45_09335 [Gemmatimonadaceae bacterium]|nr:hypothetical protein [Gemmatimonadaceae bacterium]
MTGGRPPRRRYSDDEVALIIRRASELQQADAAAREPGSGLSLTELEEVAREAGLDPALVRRAAADVESRQPASVASRFLGAPTRIQIERTVEGELPPVAFEMLVDEMRRTLGETGQTSVLGRTLAWNITPATHRHAQTRRVHVSVVSRAGLTTIRVEESLTALSTGLFGGLVGGMGGGSGGIAVGVGLGVFGSALTGAGLWMASVLGAYSLARGIFARKSRGRAAELGAMADRLATIATDAVQDARVGDAARLAPAAPSTFPVLPR